MPAPRQGHHRPGSTARASTVLSVQYLRAAAAMAVVLCHVGGHAGLNWSTGAAGVDVFFVISGFIIWTVTANNPARTARHAPRAMPARFLLDRLTRIAPPYLLLTFAVYIGATRIPGAFPNMQTSWQHALLSALFIPHTDPYGTAFPLIIPGWTLNFEMFFYLVFAAALVLAPRARLLALTAAFAVLAATGAALPSGNAAIATYTSPLLLEFAAGLWLGAAWQHRRLLPPGWGYAAMIVGAGALAVWQAVSGMEPVHFRALAWGLPAVLIVAGALSVEAQGRIPALRPLLILGDASFSLYLVNVFAVAAVWRLMPAAPVAVNCLAAIFATVAAGLIFWRGVERPLTFMARHWVHRPAPHTIPILPAAPVPHATPAALLHNA